MCLLINYFRQCFCKHELELISKVKHFENEASTMPCRYTNVYFCQKCGYMKKIEY